MSMTLVSEKEIKPFAVKEEPYTGESLEMMAFCPGCKAIQTVWLNGDRLMSTRKFTQLGNHIYHNCGSSQPCRLYHNA
jgi:hypothetical protein